MARTWTQVSSGLHVGQLVCEQFESVVVEQVAEQAREDGLQREDERDPRGADAALGPDLDQHGERAREDPGHQQRSPDGRAVRHLELPQRQREGQKRHT